jgi:hypothetical protein
LAQRLLFFAIVRTSLALIIFIFLLAIAVDWQQAVQVTAVVGVPQISVLNAPGFSNGADDSQFIAADDDAGEAPNLPLVESGMSVDDFLALFPPTISIAVFHIVHPRPPELLRL